MKYSFPEDRKATIAADWVVESAAGGRRAPCCGNVTRRDASQFVSWEGRIQLAIRTAVAQSALPRRAGRHNPRWCAASRHWVANPVAPLIVPNPGSIQCGGTRAARALLWRARPGRGIALWRPPLAGFQLPLTGWKSHSGGRMQARGCLCLLAPARALIGL